MSRIFCGSLASVYFILQLCTTASETAGDSSRFFPPIYREVITALGANATFQWRYVISPVDKPDFSQIIWGIWKSYQPYPKLITVLATNGRVIENPDLSTVAPSYRNRIFWNGNLDNSLIRFLLEDVSLSDQRKYGCFLVLGYLRPFIRSSLDLSVAEKARSYQLVKRQHIKVTGVSGECTELRWSFRKQKYLQNKPTRFTLALWDKHLQIFENIVTRTKTTEDWADKMTTRFKGRLLWNGDFGKGLAQFKLSQLTPKDELRFFCIAHFDNPKRLFYVSSQLHVKATPVITNITGNITVDEGKPFRLFCESDGTPASNVSWFVNGKRLTLGLGRSTLELNISRDEEGWYECQAFDSSGGTLMATRNRTFVAVNFDPFPPVIIKVDPTPWTAKVSWESIDRKKGRWIEDFRIQLWTDKGGRSTNKSYFTKESFYVIHGLCNNTKYSVRVFAKSRKGYGPPSDNKTFKTPYEGRPEMPVIINNRSIVNNSNFELRWKEPFNGGSAITQYTVWFREITINRSLLWNKRNVTRTEYKVYLERGRKYEFAVTAWNIHGQSVFDMRGRRFFLEIAHPITKAWNEAVAETTPIPTTRSNDSMTKPNEEDVSVDALLWQLVLIVSLFVAVILLTIFLVQTKKRQHVVENNKEIRAESPWTNEVTRSSISRLYGRPSQKPSASHELREANNFDVDPVYSMPHLPDPWELPRSDLVINSIFGKGAFGKVAKGYAQGVKGARGLVEVAVKMLRDDASDSDSCDLLSELEIMKKLSPHPNVIKLIGCVTKCHDGPMVIVEFASNGDLLGFLRKTRGVEDLYYNTGTTNRSLTTKELLRFSLDVASGMSHLSASGIVHRDLAARNVLVNKHRVCKITDFGMSRDVHGQGIYRMGAGGRLPIKWTSLESLVLGEYTTQSDVWSFGIVLYEIFSLGGTPYPEIASRDLLPLISDGYRMPRPPDFDERLYSLMMQCWCDEPKERPTFPSLCSTLKMFAG